jgi:hypothetical protein
MELFSYILSQSVHCWFFYFFVSCFVFWYFVEYKTQEVFFGSFRNKIMSSANRDSLTSSLPMCIPFIYSSCLIALARNCKIMLNRSGESGHLSPFLTLGEMVSVFPIKYDFGCRFVIYSLHYVEVHSFYSYFIRAFIMKRCWLLLKVFFCIYWDNQMVFCLCFC